MSQFETTIKIITTFSITKTFEALDVKDATEKVICNSDISEYISETKLNITTNQF